MCLLLLFYKAIPGYPMVLCANRDEYFNRPAGLPELWSPPQGVPFLAPRDLQAGGTWIGLNRNGGFAAVTNRKGIPFVKEAPSRGRLCAEVLAQGDARSMVLHGLERATQEQHNGFNLLMADQENAWLLIGVGSRVRCVGISPGIHLLSNEHDLDLLALPAEEEWHTKPASESELLDRLTAILKSHEALDEHGFAPCKHFENRGTRSAAVFIFRPQGVRYLFADGPPCTTPFEDYSVQAQEMVRNMRTLLPNDGM
ncbi:MAG: NRDE family protein [Planctomycetes bacterium]|nr:NRDE family protein [Planctomycetota bacterium]